MFWIIVHVDRTRYTNLMAKDFEDKVLKALGGLKTDVKRLEVLHEETADKIDQIIETVSPEVERANEHTLRLDDHENRINLLEKTA